MKCAAGVGMHVDMTAIVYYDIGAFDVGSSYV